ncbi:Bcr/CflA subfamily drug resistance transporter [Arcticibacter pallidicorallinus]|uniref:Bcr/CflA subfamily drug resistance transporter n=1 Tax=Arcticibacter pallidicorallinus TaxID=1259464 RepID=A0A2T0U5E9_9SPHI|nr:Bcr/CflA family efflux MFS transporter [Arcticibacter pallidicorallinus]PRY53068.1 Bcr/CflA subfamily drug resistance transporter [Arcticibacter pallidicorallinus]
MAPQSTSTKRLKDSNQRISTILAFALIPLSGFATDIYLPSLPSMSAVLNVSSTRIQLTLTLFLITYGISQLFIGSIVDSFGRYKISLICLIVFALSCIVISTTSNIYIIYLMRIIHGFTVAAVIVAKRAFFVDVYEGEKLKHYLSLFSIIWSTGPIIAPFVGGYLQNAFGWESNFYFLAGMASILAILEFIYSGETLKNFSKFSVSKMVGVYGDMLKTPSFSLGLIMLGLAYCMVMVFNMTGPFIIEHHFNGTPIIAGYSSLILGFAWMTGGFIGKATINRPFVKKMVVNIGLQLLFVATMLLSIPIVSNLYSMIFFAFIIHVTAGYIFNNYFTYCLGRFPNNAGIASGLTGGITYVIVSFLSYGVVSLLPAKDELNLGYSYLLVTVLSVFVMWMVYKSSRREVTV